MSAVTCGAYRMPPLRAELQAAYEAMDATSSQPCAERMTEPAWEVNIRSGNIDSALDGR